MLAPRDPTVQVLLAVADSIEEQGWCQGANREGTARCVTYALYEATWPHGIYGDALQRLGRVIGVGHSMEIPLWNDAPDRTKAEVVEALRQAAFMPVDEERQT